jgi:hypothetical protein
MPTVNESRAFTFMEIINEGGSIPEEIYGLAIYGFGESGVGSISAPANAVTRPR